MSRGPSGISVVEVESELKKVLYAALRLDRTTHSDWFRKRDEAYLPTRQGSVHVAAEAPPPSCQKRRLE
ncbi:MAG: hypothetical protein DIJKHBIC_02930 [Thermoanaerobaculia bacterium]|nr:hypothetical protein [Thermoanaerobaculia bacterium]